MRAFPVALRSNVVENSDLATVAGPAAGLGFMVLTYVGERTRMGELTGESPRTYRKSLWPFVRFAGADLAVSKVNRRHVERWLQSMKVAPATMRQRLSALRSFSAWCVEHGYMKKDPTVGIKGARQPRSVPPRGLPGLAVASLFESCADARAELLVSLMVNEGLRCIEVSRLEVGDVDAEHRAVLITGKGGHQRVLPISEETWALLRTYLGYFPATAGPLVRSYRNPRKGLSAHYISMMVGQLMKDAAVAESAHALRHTAATDMLRGGAHVRDVQAAMGHANLKTTERYLPWCVNDLRDAMGGRTYRRRPPPTDSGPEPAA